MELDPSTFATMSPEEFAQTVTQMTDPEIVELMRGEHRLTVLGTIFERFPDLFRGDRAPGLGTTTHFRITGGPEGRPHDTYEVIIDDGQCSIAEQPGPECDVSFTMAPPEFMKIVTGRATPPMLVMRGLIPIRGDLAAAATFPSLFDIPKA